eukprot:30918-Pelagococcus_subviridis.AAC.28
MTLTRCPRILSLYRAYSIICLFKSMKLCSSGRSIRTVDAKTSIFFDSRASNLSFRSAEKSVGWRSNGCPYAPLPHTYTFSPPVSTAKVDALAAYTCSTMTSNIGCLRISFSMYWDFVFLSSGVMIGCNVFGMKLSSKVPSPNWPVSFLPHT